MDLIERRPTRATLFDFAVRAERASESNKFCLKGDLGSEPTVEQFFIIRLLKDMGYRDAEIRPKASLAEITVARGRKKGEPYRPDYALVVGKDGGVARWVVDAKAVDEAVDDWAFQGAGYALGLNRLYEGEDPCQYYVITNGLELKVWKWNEAMPVLALQFGDFQDDNPSYRRLQGLLGASVVRQGWGTSRSKPAKAATLTLTKPSVEEVKRIFKRCHDLIWKAEKINPQPAYFEFVKVMFVKLYSDRQLHEDNQLGKLIERGEPIPRDAVTFSTWWVDALTEHGAANPINDLKFTKLRDVLAEAVAQGHKKPIFDAGERIALHPGTLRQVVSKLESYDMFGIDEDLNGRLFETFLNATMRGKDLGQFFTPRSITKLMTRIADPHANRNGVDKIIDACCGSGGFLIEALTEMRNEVRGNVSLTPNERSHLNDQIANHALFGIDAGQNPPLARIARINMYLHGDGGSRIYAADALDKRFETNLGSTPRRETDELKGEIQSGEGFDIALTNPPFSMGYSRILPNEEVILDQYDLSTFRKKAAAGKPRPTLSSRVMFIERYADMLKPGGRLLTVIDDSTLSTAKYGFARQFIRERFIVRAIISLPGDAFQRVGARAKTSILYLVKRKPGETEQPDIFMAESPYIGLDDVPPKTPVSRANNARRLAERDSEQILDAFRKFMAGEKGPWLVPANSIQDRLDVKFCLPRPEREDVAQDWIANGLEVIPLGDIVDEAARETLRPSDSPDEEFTFLRVRYDGIPEEGETRLGREITYSELRRAAEGDIVVSNIAMALGATCVLPQDLSHTLLSSEFTVVRVVDGRFDPWFLWGFLRSPEVKARLLSVATGISRHRISWDSLKDIPVPVFPKDRQEALAERYSKLASSIREVERNRFETDTELYEALDLSNAWATQRLTAAKPPK